MEYTLSTTLTTGLTTAVLASTRKLREGLFAYNSNLPVFTKIDSITDDTDIELTKEALADYVGNIIFSDLQPSRYAERCNAMKDVQAVVDSEGTLIEFILRDEDQVTRDDYNSIKKKTQMIQVLLKAFPVTYSPSKKFLEKVGLREDNEVIIHTAMKDWLDKGYNYDDIEILRSTVKLNDNTYQVKEKTLADYVGNNGIYVVLGLKK
jgi:hypothetical protein